MPNEWQKIIRKVRKDWGRDSTILTMIKGLKKKLRPDAVRMLTMPMFEALFPDSSREDVKKLIRYLSGDRIELLSVEFGLLDEMGFMHDIDAREVKEYLQNKTPVVDPRNGELLPDLDDALIYFRGTDKLKILLEDSDGRH